MKIVVIAGGLSPERDVSLSSGSLIANALIEIGYKVCLADLYAGVEITDYNYDKIFFDSKSGKRYSYSVPQYEPDLDKLKKEVDNGESLIGKNIIELCKSADLTFLALHGDIGENGKLQAIFDSYGILYTGTGYIGSLLAMDKDLAKMLMIQNQILTPQWELFELSELTDNNPESTVIEFPCVIKPCSCGSSVGVSIVKNREEFISAVKYAKKYEKKIIIEKLIEGREFSVGVLDNKALPVIEIIPNEDFYDYKHKYQPGTTEEVCPADLPKETADRLKDIALKVHKILRLGSYSRIDFIAGNNGDIYCLEANTLPGMTPTSLLPQEAKAAGISYHELCGKIVKMALEK